MIQDLLNQRLMRSAKNLNRIDLTNIVYYRFLRKLEGYGPSTQNPGSAEQEKKVCSSAIFKNYTNLYV